MILSWVVFGVALLEVGLSVDAPLMVVLLMFELLRCWWLF